MTNKIVLATGNKGKVAELSQMLAPLQYQIVPQSELAVSDADETGLTFIENAIIKARHAALATGLPAIADDSGLAVDALGGAPGIYSARYAGEAASDADNIKKLLQALQDVPKAQRSAQFHCVLVYLRHAEDPTPLVCYIAAEGCTSAELSRERKAQLSHRGKALAQLVSQLTQLQA
jgi:XTP/dITP diphosphohydrolase